MNVGLLWFDNDPRTPLTDKVERAADYYRRKYGRIPDMCLVHPTMLGSHPDKNPGHAGKVALRTNRAIMPGHLWIGEDDKN
jgi:hypothetical protein